MLATAIKMFAVSGLRARYWVVQLGRVRMSYAQEERSDETRLGEVAIASVLYFSSGRSPEKFFRKSGENSPLITGWLLVLGVLSAGHERATG